MICEIEFVKHAVKLGKGVNELSFWWSWHGSERPKSYVSNMSLVKILLIIVDV